MDAGILVRSVVNTRLRENRCLAMTYASEFSLTGQLYVVDSACITRAFDLTAPASLQADCAFFRVGRN